MMDNILTDDIQDIAVGSAAMVLENGGETYRAEETAVRVGLALGAKKADAFVTPTVVNFSYIDEMNHHHTYMHRVMHRETNLRKLALVNDLSRRLVRRGKKSNPKQIESILSRIDNSKDYSPVLVVFMAALSSACFTLMFGGSFLDAVAAFVIGLVLRLVLFAFSRRPDIFNSFISSLLSGAIISVLADVIALTPLPISSPLVTIGTLMQVVPGLALVNSIRDIISGDLVSGAARFLDACMIAAALSIGSVTGVFVAKFIAQFYPLVDSAPLWIALDGNLVAKFIFALLWSFGASFFATFYMNVALVDITFCGFIGAAGWVLYTLVLVNGGSAGGAYFCGAFAVAVLSEFFALIKKRPATVFLLPGLLPLVPGGGIFYMMRYVVQGELNAVGSAGYDTLIAAGAIALGIAIASSIGKVGRVFKGRLAP